MPEISRFYGIKIYFFFRDHNPPHFHASYGEDEALISINTLEIMEGSLPKRALLLVVEWALLHRGELMQAWEIAVKGEVPAKIKPLR